MTESESVALPLGDAALFEQYVLYHIFPFCQDLWGGFVGKEKVFFFRFFGGEKGRSRRKCLQMGQQAGYFSSPKI